MFDASKLIGEFLGATGGGSTSSNSSNSNAGGAGNLLQQGQNYLSQNAGGISGGAIAGGLAGMMMGSKKGRKMAKKAATYGGLALVAGLAYKAYNDYQTNKSGPVIEGTGTSATQPASAPVGQVPQISHVPAVPVGSGFEVEAQSSTHEGFGATLVSAMITAAKADGKIDAAEHQAIFDKIEELDLSGDEKVFLFDQLNRPLDIDSLVARAETKEQAVEIYLASLMAIEVDTPSEQAYLTMLAARLGLEPELTSHIHNTVLAAGD